MKTLFFLFIIISSNAYSWTINNSALSGFAVSDLTIKIGSDTCTNAGFTPSTLEAIVNDAIDEYWSKVPTSSLKLKTGGDSGISLIADDLTAAANKSDSNGIIIGCSQNASLFSSSGILGLGGIGCTGSICHGAVLMNDTAGTALASTDRATVVTALAHEIGHAVGLGHSSIQGALMYYNLSGKTQKTLHQDDIDGISYLYPNDKKLGGVAGTCATIDTNSKNKNNFPGSMILGIAIVFLVSKLKKRAIFR